MIVSGIISGSLLRIECEESFGRAYAFDVYKNGSKIFTQDYTVERKFDYDTAYVFGYYSVTVRMMDGAGAGENSACHINVYLGFPFVPVQNAHEIFDDQLSGAFLIPGNTYQFHSIYLPRKAEKRLFVLLTASVERAKYKVPIFDRWSHTNRFPGYLLSVSDPTLDIHPRLDIGWYLGSSEHDATAELADIVKIFASRLNIPHSHIVFYGCSAGGFAALALASHIPGSIAVALNPQIIVTKYMTRFVEEMLEDCFDNMDKVQALKTYPMRFSMAERYKNAVSYALVAQNFVDNINYITHYLPFAVACGIPEGGGFQSTKNAEVGFFMTIKAMGLIPMTCFRI
jgi:hypothetical protein